jgi:hypothetical protein
MTFTVFGEIYLDDNVETNFENQDENYTFLY